VTAADGWYAAGGSTTLTATAGANWHFTGWSGDTNGCGIAGNVITAAMTQARSITANFTIDQKTLTVVSAHGGEYPGTETADWGAALSQFVTNSPVSGGVGTQYVCTGWTMNGNEPTNGSGTNCTLTLTNDATLSWAWQTEYWLTAATNGNGTVTAADGWYATGGSTTLTATAGANWHFNGWTGDTNGCGIAGNVITAAMTQARSITANFAANMATNNTPHWWLAQYGLPTNDAGALYDEGDGMPAWAEYVAGTDPTNANSVFRLTSGVSLPWEGFVLRWSSISNRFYDLSRATNLLAGTNAFMSLPDGINLPATPPENSYTDRVNGVGPYFYKIGVHQ
jgi:uncharacterized repeat protein (TIGR02543 family)